MEERMPSQAYIEAELAEEELLPISIRKLDRIETTLPSGPNGD